MSPKSLGTKLPKSSLVRRRSSRPVWTKPVRNVGSFCQCSSKKLGEQAFEETELAIWELPHDTEDRDCGCWDHRSTPPQCQEHMQEALERVQCGPWVMERDGSFLEPIFRGCREFAQSYTPG